VGHISDMSSGLEVVDINIILMKYICDFNTLWEDRGISSEGMLNFKSSILFLSIVKLSVYGINTN